MMVKGGAKAGGAQTVVRGMPEGILRCSRLERKREKMKSKTERAHKRKGKKDGRFVDDKARCA